ncbi:MAG TPA: protein-glutamate O-methyltransferase CheR [Gemmatimonadaceae bacterium]|nr:protein-glutamate O-methyltransferase CheR [Gemmatimonadaceae bacterium]
MTAAQIDRAFAALTAKISRDRGFGCASYKERCLRRRIAVRMRARNVHTYEEYACLLDADVQEYELLLDALTINVTKFFRNWESFAALERIVVPALWARREEQLRIWSAGCASGEEAYSLAILLHRHAALVGELRRLSRVKIVATDIDKASLELAERGEYGEPSFADTPLDIRRAYFSSKTPYRVHDEVRQLVRFQHRDLLNEPPPGQELHLIACRNVIIYFDRDSQEALFSRFRDALAPGGVLVLGKVETLLGEARNLFQPLESRERIFRRQ